MIRFLTRKHKLQTSRLWLLSAVLLCACGFRLYAQSGCTDAQANNYNAAALLNDGSCLYPTTNYSPTLVSTLGSKLNEISGLQYADDKWWAFSDSGNDATFYVLKPESGNIKQDVKLKNSENHDWEDIARDSTNLYIGDFGNNTNDRLNLGIYRIPLNKIGNSDNETVDDNEYQFLPYHYADQTDFSFMPSDSAEYDCEAMLYYQGKLHLFSKNRKKRISTHYILNENDSIAVPRDTLLSNGLITAADISPDGKVIALLGYDLLGIPSVFMWLLWDWPGDSFFMGNKRRIELGNALILGKAESIAFLGPRNGYIANEKTTYSNITLVEPSIWSFDISAWISAPSRTQSPTLPRLTLGPNPCSDRLYIHGHLPQQLILRNMLGQVVLERYGELGPEGLDVSGLPSGLYSLELEGYGGELIQVIR